MAFHDLRAFEHTNKTPSRPIARLSNKRPSDATNQMLTVGNLVDGDFKPIAKLKSATVEKMFLTEQLRTNAGRVLTLDGVAALHDHSLLRPQQLRFVQIAEQPEQPR